MRSLPNDAAMPVIRTTIITIPQAKSFSLVREDIGF
jgi:hypothetical protein